MSKQPGDNEDKNKTERRMKNLYRWLNPKETNEFLNSDFETPKTIANVEKDAKLFPSELEILDRAKLIEKNQVDDEELYSFSSQFGPISRLTKDQKKDILKLIEKNRIDIPIEYKTYLTDLIDEDI